MKSKKKRIIERVVILSVAVIVVGLLVFFLKDVFFPFIKMQFNKDTEGAKALLEEKGFLGYVTVSLVEALQMVVIFIPAEFIQLTSGMSYPWWLAIILCDIGVMLGCSIIYFLVNIFRFDGDIFNKGNKIQDLEKRTRTKNAIVFMYILFIMPIVPFGAICYYASSKKIPYHKYLITCATGVIPSICTSIFMGAAVKLFIAQALPIWVLILAIIGAAGILLVLLIFVLHRFVFKDTKDTPYSIFYTLSIIFTYRLLKLKHKFRVTGKEKLRDLDGSFILLANHHSYLDVFATAGIDTNLHWAYVINKYYQRIPVFGKMVFKSGVIPKMMFTPDMNCVKGIIKNVKKGYPIVIFPEGRLSTDGGPSPINESLYKLILMCKVPIVLTRISNAYFNKPKWRKSDYRGEVRTEIKEVITADEVKNMTPEQLKERVENVLYFNEFEIENVHFKKKNLAEGVENILYRCPHCGTLYSNVSKGNEITCTHCGKTYHIKPDYQFEEDDIKNIHDYYQLIRKLEAKDVENQVLDVEVDTVIFSKDFKKKRKDHGIFHFDKDTISYKSSLSDIYFEYKTTSIEGIAYSVNEEFEMYHQGELYYFYPEKSNRKVCTRIPLLHELLMEKNYGQQEESKAN